MSYYVRPPGAASRRCRRGVAQQLHTAEIGSSSYCSSCSRSCCKCCNSCCRRFELYELLMDLLLLAAAGNIPHLAPASYFHMRFAFSPNIAEMRFSRRNPVFLEIRGVYGVSPPLAGAEARGIQELTGRLYLKSRRVITNMVAGIPPEQRCDAMRLSLA